MNNKFTRRGLFGMLGGMVAAKYLPKPKAITKIGETFNIRVPSRFIGRTRGEFTPGDVFTISGVNRINPATGADTGILQQFVKTLEGNAWPAIIERGHYRNVIVQTPEIPIERRQRQLWTPLKNNSQIKSWS